LSQEVKVERDLVFQGNASHTSNVKGNFSFENKVVHYDDFFGLAIDTTNDYTFAGVNSGTATVTVPHCLTLTTGNADNDDCDLAMGVEWYGQYNAVMEARFRIDDVDTSAINVGFTEATGTAADTIAVTVSGTTVTTTAVEYAGFVWDADATGVAAYVLALSCKNNADGATIASDTAAEDGKWFTSMRMGRQSLLIRLRKMASGLPPVWNYRMTGLRPTPSFTSTHQALRLTHRTTSSVWSWML
jgi:hypothetical protein